MMNRIDAQTLLSAMESTWLVVTPDGSSLAMVSPVHAEGMVAPLYTTEGAAEEAAESYPPELKLAFRPAPPLWDVTRLLAAQGFVGILVDEQYPLFFVTTEAGSELPTHVALPDGEGLLILDREGPTGLQPGEVERWVNWDAFDLLSIRWMLGEERPFLEYEERTPLVEYLPAESPQLIDEAGLLLGEEPGERQAIPFFSSAHAAEWYWEQRAEVHFTGEGEYADQLAVHVDVVARLEGLREEMAEVALILNPGRHRFYQGFFRKVKEQWYLITINGIWRVDPPFRCTRVARRIKE